MHYTRLGHSDIVVSRVCLGTMTFGEQNDAGEAFRLLDLAVDHGVTFVDTAELYPVPPKAATAGRTETILGGWMKARRNRPRLIVATKIAGPGADHLRAGGRVFTAARLREAIEGSLRRLGTDVVDLYQLHWPERPTNTFGRLGYEHAPDEDFTPLGEVLAALGDLVRRGLIRAVGVSNETPWGVMRYLDLADRDGLPRPVAIQNPYSLLNRTFEIGLAEVAIREACGLLAYSPLAFGTLSGKYLDGATPAGARLTLFPHYRRYSRPEAVAATRGYVGVARAHGLDPAQMALAYVLSRPFVTSAIVGATTLQQLRSNLGATTITLDPAVVEAIEAVHTRHPNPAP
jgi:aryl-alcohol dehydrogenase-like predicted oxidoreductase